MVHKATVKKILKSQAPFKKGPFGSPAPFTGVNVRSRPEPDPSKPKVELEHLSLGPRQTEPMGSF